MSVLSPIVELRHVSRVFGDQAILRDINLPVYRGETLAVIGESGCGKSVTLKLLMRLMEPSSGEVFWEGRPIARLAERELSQERLKFGYLFQMAALFDSLSVYENVAFGLLQNTRLPAEVIRQKVRDRLRDVGLSLDVVGHKKPAQLSGGQKKRVGLARAMALDPEVVLYDEPTTGLDPIMSDVINELILHTRQGGRVTSIVVTHDMHTVRKVADRVVMFYPLSRLDAGENQIIYEGTAAVAFDHHDKRVSQFVRGEAGERLMEMAAA